MTHKIIPSLLSYGRTFEENHLPLLRIGFIKPRSPHFTKTRCPQLVRNLNWLYTFSMWSLQITPRTPLQIWESIALFTTKTASKICPSPTKGILWLWSNFFQPPTSFVCKNFCHQFVWTTHILPHCSAFHLHDLSGQWLGPCCIRERPQRLCMSLCPSPTKVPNAFVTNDHPSHPLLLEFFHSLPSPFNKSSHQTI